MSNHDALLRSYGPSAWWKLADAPGSLTAADSSGNGYTGIVNGGVTFGEPGPMAGSPQDTACSFAGAGTIQNNGAVPGPVSAGLFTIVAWCVPSAGHYNAVLAVYPSSTPSNPIVLYPAYKGSSGSGPITLQVPTGVSTNVYLSGASASLEVWGMSVVTFDGTNFRLYVDGVLGGSFATPAGYPLAAALEALKVGAIYDFPGTLAEVAIFPYALTAAQVAALWSPPPLVSGGSGFPMLVGR